VVRRHVPAAAIAALTLIATGATAAATAPQAGQAAVEALGPARSACLDVDTPLPRLAALLDGAGAGARGALRQMASSTDVAVRWCGLRGLAALRDDTLPAAVLEAWRWRREDAYLPARWATWAAGGPDAAASRAYQPLVDALADPGLLSAAGDDGVRLLGEVDTPAARDALLPLVARDDAPATVDAAILALARQGDARARTRVTALGQTVINGLGGNAMFEEARRIHAAGVYLMALGADGRDAGLAMLTRLSPADQTDAAAWAVQTLCERGVRRPAERDAAMAARAALVDALGGRGIRWDAVTRGTFPCPAAP
jgi:hypothetical protein